MANATCVGKHYIVTTLAKTKWLLGKQLQSDFDSAHRSESKILQYIDAARILLRERQNRKEMNLKPSTLLMVHNPQYNGETIPQTFKDRSAGYRRHIKHSTLAYAELGKALFQSHW